MDELQIGDLVDQKYRLLREIARGGGGIVFESEHIFTTRRVAIKVLLRGGSGQVESGSRLLREARALSVARHRNVVEVLDAGKDAIRGAYLVMELLEGRSVDGLLASRGKLSHREVVWLGAQVAQGAAKLHRHGLVHRDIKPSNIFVKYDEQGEEVVTLIDFGTVTHEDLRSPQRITRDNGLIGTPEYMSPEQLTSAAVIDHRTDIYSIGVMLYECLLGGVPHGGSYGEILLSVHTGRPRLLIEEEHAVAPELLEIIIRAMALEPDARYKNATELAGALAGLLRNESADSLSLLGVYFEGSGQAGTSRRRHTRAPFVTPIVVVLSDGSVRLGKTQDVSTGGILAIVQGVCVAARIVAIRMALPAAGSPFEAKVVGRWAKPGGQGTVLGIEFTDLPEEHAEDIRSYVARLVAFKALLSPPDGATVHQNATDVSSSESRLKTKGSSGTSDGPSEHPSAEERRPPRR